MAEIAVNADHNYGGVGKIKGLAAASANGEAVRYEQLDAYQLESEKGQANGYAGLDGSGKVPTSQLPASVVGALVYGGTWNANTNSPTLTSGESPEYGQNQYYIVSTNGATDLDGITDWKNGDWAVFNGTEWEKIDNTDQVTSVAGRTGAVTLTVADVSGALAAASNLGDVANAATARTNLGLGSMAVQASGSVTITGGSITGITDLAVADGGTGASTAANARKNLGAVGQYTELFGDGTSTSFVIEQTTHGLAANSRIDVLVQDATTGEAVVWATTVDPTTGDVTLEGNAAPTSNSRRATLFGIPA